MRREISFTDEALCNFISLGDRSGKEIRSSDRAIDGHGGTQSASEQALADRGAYIAGKK